MRAATLTSLLLVALLLSACDSLPWWMGGHKKKVDILPGDRSEVLAAGSTVPVDKALVTATFTLPDATINESWPQHGGNATASVGHVALGAARTSAGSVAVGDGREFRYGMLTPPVIANGVVFAMDGEGKLSAHSADLSKTIWENDGVAVEDEDYILGGGLATDGGVLYVASGRGRVAAYNGVTGAELWRQQLNIPMRSAPKIHNGKLAVVTVDNQLFVLDAANGSILWSDRDVNEGAGYLVGASPAIQDEVIIAPYSSAQVKVMDVNDGAEMWKEALIQNKKTFAAGAFTGIGADPIVQDGTLYVVSNAGLLAAFRLNNGQPLWEQPISAIQTPAIAGDYVFVLASDNQLFSIDRHHGRVRWATQLRNFSNEEKQKGKLSWAGPVLAGGRLLVVGEHGQMLEISPDKGEVLDVVDIPDDVAAAPIVANGTLYLLDKAARLHAVK